MFLKHNALRADHDFSGNNLVPTDSHMHSLLAPKEELKQYDGTTLVLLFVVVCAQS
jgi:hypothetical protein